MRLSKVPIFLSRRVSMQGGISGRDGGSAGGEESGGSDGKGK
jgi:hypothetical protein